MRIRTILALAAVPAALAASLLGTTAASAAANPNAATTGATTCAGDLSQTVIATNLNVPAGATCRLFANEVKGNVTVQGSLYTFGAITFDRNVSVTGGEFKGSNWGVTVNGNLSFIDPAPNSQNGFFGNYSPNEVKGNMSYVIDSSTAYPCYQSPLLYFGGGTKVDGSFNYSDYGTGFAGHLDQNGLNVVRSKSTLMGTGSC